MDVKLDYREDIDESEVEKHQESEYPRDHQPLHPGGEVRADLEGKIRMHQSRHHYSNPLDPETRGHQEGCEPGQGIGESGCVRPLQRSLSLADEGGCGEHGTAGQGALADVLQHVMGAASRVAGRID